MRRFASAAALLCCVSHHRRFHEEAKNLPDAYERLILDVARGDHNLFVRADEVGAPALRWQPLFVFRLCRRLLAIADYVRCVLPVITSAHLRDVCRLPLIAESSLLTVLAVSFCPPSVTRTARGGLGRVHAAAAPPGQGEGQAHPVRVRQPRTHRGALRNRLPACLLCLGLNGTAALV
jgi:hypothetical protein